MELIVIGSGGSYPTPNRSASSFLLKINDENYWLFDCGEGTTCQLMKTHISLDNITKIFITHLHGDHMYGLPGLLWTMALVSRKSPLEVYGPHGIRKLLRVSFQLSRAIYFKFQYTVHELIPHESQFPANWGDMEVDQDATGDPLSSECIGETFHCDSSKVWNLINTSQATVRAGPILHPVPSFGYVVETNGRKVTVLGDTYDTSAINDLVRGSDLLTHESTLLNEMEEEAIFKGHSTPRMAADFAKRCGVKKLLLTHFSQRYCNDSSKAKKKGGHKVEDYVDVNCLLAQAKAIFENTLLASDLLTVPI